jgi:hypothetical protein
MATIPDFSETELDVIRQTLRERYGHEVDMQLVESEIRLHKTDRELTLCPGVYWTEKDCHFIVLKTGQQNYRCRFFYRVSEEYATGIDEYNDILDCIISLLRAEADHESKRQQDTA